MLALLLLFFPQTQVDPAGVVSSEVIFPPDWKIALDVSYINSKSRYEAPVGFISFKAPGIVVGPIPQDSVIFEPRPIFLFARTHHDDNAGHLVFDQYHPILTAIRTHLGSVYAALNVTTVDMVWRQHIFSRWNGMYDNWWKVNIGRLLFHDQIENKAFFHHVRHRSTKPICYETVIAGCGKLSGLDGQVLHRSDSIQYIRERLWQEYAPQRTKNNPEIINFLLLEKNFSSWKHMNTILNWSDLKKKIQSLPGVSVINIAPQNTNFSVQVQEYRNADVIVSLWGGISMLNFLMPSGGVEILITSWYGTLMPYPKYANQTTLPCPDFDGQARMSISGASKSLRYCTRDDGYAQNTINITNFMELVQKAVKYIKWKRKQK